MNDSRLQMLELRLNALESAMSGVSDVTTAHLAPDPKFPVPSVLEEDTPCPFKVSLGKATEVLGVPAMPIMIDAGAVFWYVHGDENGPGRWDPVHLWDRGQAYYLEEPGDGKWWVIVMTVRISRGASTNIIGFMPETYDAVDANDAIAKASADDRFIAEWVGTYGNAYYDIWTPIAVIHSINPYPVVYQRMCSDLYLRDDPAPGICALHVGTVASIPNGWDKVDVNIQNGDGPYLRIMDDGDVGVEGGDRMHSHDISYNDYQIYEGSAANPTTVRGLGSSATSTDNNGNYRPLWYGVHLIRKL
jgi:hypothetical protein